MKLKIKIIFTGGTISSHLTKNGVDVNENSDITKKLLISNYANSKFENRKKVEFSSSQPLSVLSENISIDDWNILIEELKSTPFSDFDGIIIAHGTDTLAFTSNMLSTLMAGISIPIILVSSDLVLTDEKSNGNANFEGAVDFICERKYTGVFSIYKNQKDELIVYLGSRLKQAQSITNAFSSSNGMDFGIMKDGKFHPYTNSLNPTREHFIEILKNKSPLIYEVEKIKPCVLIINPHIGLDYNNITPTKNIKAILHGLYHASTASTLSNSTVTETSIIKFNKTLLQNKIALFIAPFDSSIAENYVTTKEMLENGITPIYDVSTEMAYAKLLIIFSLDNHKFDHILNENIFFEKSK